MLEFVDPCRKRTTYLVWMTVREEEKIKGRYSSSFEISAAKPACGAHSHSVPGTVPGTSHVSSHLVLALTFIILILKEHFG